MEDPSQSGNDAPGWGPQGASAPTTAPVPPQPTPPGEAGPGWFGQVAASGYQPSDQERELAFYVHLSAAMAAFVSCSLVLGLVPPLALYAHARQKPPFLQYHVQLAVLFQAACTAAQLVITLGSTMLGLLLGPYVGILGFLPWLAASIYPFVVALWARGGEWKGYRWLDLQVRDVWRPLVN